MAVRAAPAAAPGRSARVALASVMASAALDGAATYLGLTEDKLREQLQAGKSLADVAKATSGKTVEGLKAAIKDAPVKQLDQAVKDGKLTAAQRDKIVSALDAAPRRHRQQHAAQGQARRAEVPLALVS